jgi:hypothetical protein
MSVGFSVQPSPWLVVLPMISGFGLGIVYGRTFLENPGPCLPQPLPQHAAAVIPTIAYVPDYATRLEVSPLLGRPGAAPCGCVAF